jgi:hypothetical protein
VPDRKNELRPQTVPEAFPSAVVAQKLGDLIGAAGSNNAKLEEIRKLLALQVATLRSPFVRASGEVLNPHGFIPGPSLLLCQNTTTGPVAVHVEVTVRWIDAAFGPAGSYFEPVGRVFLSTIAGSGGPPVATTIILTQQSKWFVLNSNEALYFRGPDFLAGQAAFINDSLVSWQMVDPFRS